MRPAATTAAAPSAPAWPVEGLGELRAAGPVVMAAHAALVLLLGALVMMVVMASHGRPPLC